MIINAVLPNVKPIPAAAHPEYEFNIDITTGISAPPIGIIIKTPINNAVNVRAQKIKCDSVKENAIIINTKLMPIRRFIRCCFGNVSGDPDTKPCNFVNATIEPVNVIAPIVTPRPISTRLDVCIFPGLPMPIAAGAYNAAAATKTAAKPTKE